MNQLVFRKHLQASGELPFSTSQLTKMENDGRLPRPIKLGPKTFCYRRAEFDAAITKLIGSA